jgi:membrane-associated phospholipid phosphatase
MEQIWQWGISVIIAVQKIRSPFFDAFFSFISFFGTLIFYMIFLPFIYWCLNKKTASRIFILFLISSWVNSVMKDLINHPRPYNLNESVKIGKTGGPGIPSGHAQQSLVVWGSISLWLRNRAFTYFTVFFILLIAFSRIYLGVHFPTDIIGGWILGALILFIIWPLFDSIESFLKQFSPVILAAAAVAVPALLSLILASKSSVMSMGALSGFCVGIMLEKKYINFSPAGSLMEGVLRYVFGAVVLMLLYSSEKFLFSKNVPHYMAYVFIHSWILSIWVAAGAPCLFKKYRI